MAGITTAFVIVGNHSVGPFATRDWRARHGIALIEKHLRVWMPSAIAHGTPDPEPIGPVIFPPGLTPEQELAILIGATAVKSPELLTALTDAGYTQPSPVPGEPPTLHIPDAAIDDGFIDPAVVDLAVHVTTDVVRLGLVRLHPTSQLDDTGLLWLRAQGYDVDEFQLAPAGSEGQ